MGLPKMSSTASTVQIVKSPGAMVSSPGSMTSSPGSMMSSPGSIMNSPGSQSFQGATISQSGIRGSNFSRLWGVTNNGAVNSQQNTEYGNINMGPTTFNQQGSQV